MGKTSAGQDDPPTGYPFQGQRRGYGSLNGLGNVNQMSNMMARAGASQAGVRSLPGSVWNMASRMAGGGGSSNPWNQLPRTALLRGVGNPWKTYGKVHGQQQQQAQLIRNVGMRNMGGGMGGMGGMGNMGGMGAVPG